MKNHEKKRLKRIRAFEKASDLVNKIRKLEKAGPNAPDEPARVFWYRILNQLTTSNIKFISNYEARDGHLFAVHVFKEALLIVLAERMMGLEE